MSTPLEIYEEFPSTKRNTVEMLSRHKADMALVMERMFKQLLDESVESREKIKIFVSILPYFYIKADVAAQLNLQEEINTMFTNGLSVKALVLIKEFIEKIKKEEGLL